MSVKIRILEALLGIAILAPVSVRAEVGSGTSAEGPLDALAPRLRFVVPEEGDRWLSGDTAPLTWILDEAHPHAAPGKNVARILSGDEQLFSRNFTPLVGTYILNWSVPDISAGDCRLLLDVTDRLGNRTVAESPRFVLLGSATDVPAVPVDRLARPRPNPFNPSTEIVFALAETGHAELAVFDLLGRRVRTLVSGTLPAGPASLVWDGCDDGGRRLPAGTYLLRLRPAAGTPLTRKAVMVP